MPSYLSPGVYVEEVEAGSRPIEGVGTAVAAFVGLAAKGPFNKPTLVTNWTQFTEEFGEFIEGSYLAHAVYGYFNNGGGACYVVRIGTANGGPARAELPSGADSTLGAYRITALEPAPHRTGRGRHGGSPSPSRSPTRPTGSADDVFTLVVHARRHGRRELRRASRRRRARQNVATVVNAAVEADPDRGDRRRRSRRAPEGGRRHARQRRRGHADPTSQQTTTSATPPTAPASEDSRQSTTSRWSRVPDLMAAYQAGSIDLEGVQAVQLAMIAHCELMGDRVAILDPPPGLNAQQVSEWRMNKAGYDSKYATLYWPWIKVFDPSERSEHLRAAERPHGRRLGPQRRQPRRPQGAGQRGRPRRASHSRRNITSGEHDQLNPDGINCIRAFPGRGIRVWGARTLSSDPAWRYVNVRRLFNYIEESILEGTQWVVFEPNDLDLWQRIRRTITAFLLGVWRDGALFGATPEEAFYVKCDAETNPPDVGRRGPARRARSASRR